MPDPFYVTTPIYYVNARPHIGHAYTTVVADVLARRARMAGRPTWFLTGTDEHGQKIERSAAAAGIPPQQFADEVSAAFQTLWQRMGITNDQYIRTTSPEHKRGVQKLFTTLYQNGKIYLDSYTGQYSIGEEMFVEGPPGTLGPDGKPTETVTEENFFFRLSGYQLPLLNLIESDELKITPESRKNEVLSFLRGPVNQASQGLGAPGSTAPSLTLGSQSSEARAPFIPEPHPGMSGSTSNLAYTAAGTPYLPGALKDLSISRSSFTWGIPVPPEIQQAAGAKHPHIIYVWLDALANYITALGYGDDSPEAQAQLQKLWPADLHLVGKEIIRFHCVYWPAFLLAAGLPLPKAVTAHGWLLFDDSKMSKSKGNIVRTETILEAFGQLCPPTPSSIDASAGEGSSFDASMGQRSSLEASMAQGSSLNALMAQGSSLDASMGQGSSLDALSEQAFSSAEDVLLKGTASAVPQDAPKPDGASAPEGISPRLDSKGGSVGLQPHESGSQQKGASAPGSPHPASNPGAPGLVSETWVSTHHNPTPAARDLFAADVLRYFLLREIPFGQDGSFSFEALITRYNADLANGYGNLVSRTLKMVETYFGGVIPQLSEFVLEHGAPEAIPDALEDAILAHLERREFSLYLDRTAEAIASTDRMLSLHRPWKERETESATRSNREFYLLVAVAAIQRITAFLYPVLPFTAGRVWQQLGLGSIEQAAANGTLANLDWAQGLPGTKLGPLGPIFPRADKKLAEILTQMESEKNTPIAHANAAYDTTGTENSEFPEAPISSEANTKKPLSKLVDETSGHTAITNPGDFDPAAGPRTSSLPESNAAAQVGGSSATNPTRPSTPSHAEAKPSGIFAGDTQRPPSTSGPHPGAGGPATSGVAVEAEPSGIFAAPADQSPQITIDDFAKVELRVAKVIVCERIPKADKLLRLEVDLGHEKRQILSGIAEWYTPEDLLGRRIVVITNLAPRKMRGLESHGMLLAASSEGGKPALATFLDSDDLPLGSRLK